MDLKNWLDAERGRYTALAKHLDVSVGRVSQMADDGVSTKFILSVRDFTGGAVTVEEMVRARTPDGTANDAQPQIETPNYTGPDCRTAKQGT